MKHPDNASSPVQNLERSLPESIDIAVNEIDQLGAVTIVDIRRPEEVAVNPLPCKHVHIVMDDLLNNPKLLDKHQIYLLVCAAGVRTQYTANAFRAAGYDNVYSLIGGNRMLDHRSC